MTDIKGFEEKPYAPLAIHSRKLAAEGCVLLKNENKVLPIKPENTVSFLDRLHKKRHRLRRTCAY